MSKATAADDRFHPPVMPDPSWAETSWFGFAAPERGLAGTLYPLFRPSLGICALGVAVWDANAHEPWRARYARRLWHVPVPEDAKLHDLSLAGLSIQVVESLRRYRVRFEDADRIRVDLEYTGLIEPHGPIVTPERGHLDQPCRVRGTLALGKEEISIDGYEMRDRSWGPRDDLRHTRAAYCYGIRNEDESFLASTMEMSGEERVVMGYLHRDGEKHDLVSGTRQVLERRDAYPVRVRIEATDKVGRTLEVEGRALSRLAEQATPGMFAWMSLTEWTTPTHTCHGEDQEVWSPDTWPVGRN